MTRSGLQWRERTATGQFAAGSTVPPETRFWAMVTKSPECWMWNGSTSTAGYGRFYVGVGADARGLQAHRFAYEQLTGAIPEGMFLDHLCHTRDLSCPGGNSCIHRRCVRPDHLEPVTNLDNIRRGRRGPRTHCLRQHPYSPENTSYTPQGWQICRECRRLSKRARAAVHGWRPAKGGKV